MKAAGAWFPGSVCVLRAGFGLPPKQTFRGYSKVEVLTIVERRRTFAKAGRLRRHARRARFPALAACALLLFVFLAAARADSLRADFSPLTLRPRTNAPAIFDIKLHRAGAGLLEGALEITFEAGGDVVLRQRTPDLTLAAGTQSFRIITPPLPPHESYIGTEARLRFVTKTAAVDLGRFPAEAASRGTRNFVIAVCDAHAAGVRDVALWQSLRLEGFFPASPSVDKPIATSPAYLAPEDFPANPLALFAFDLVLLDGDGFALLREKQLAALTHWVEAGGSLCVLPGRGLKDEHVRFLNTFAGAKNSAPFQITDTGEWMPNGSQSRLLRAGLGRVVVASHPADDALGTEAWQRAAAFLWKMRGATSDSFFSGSSGSAWRQTANLAKMMAETRTEADRRRAKMEGALNTLLPKSTHLISPGTLALILAGFLLVVGPLDWFTLGILRRRRWTWIVFPLASAGFTALVIFEAGRALGHEDHRAALIVTDVGPRGRVLRESRFELLFTARNQESLTEIHNAFAVPTTLGARSFGRRSSDGDPEPVWFSGQMPARFTMRQQLRQWTPQFNRVTSLEASGEASGIPWDEIETNVVQSRTPVVALGKIAEREAGRNFVLLHRSGDDSNFVRRQGTRIKWTEGWDSSRIRALGASSLSGLGQFVARTSPDAAAGFDDLPLLDADDSHEWLIVIFRKTPDGVHLYRRLFRTDD